MSKSQKIYKLLYGYISSHISGMLGILGSKYRLFSDTRGFPWKTAIALYVIASLFLLPHVFDSGALIFSDLDFGFKSQGYLKRIFGIWNSDWSVSTLFNSSRLLFLFPLYIISFLFSHPVGLLGKSVFLSVLTISGSSMSLLVYVLLRDMVKDGQLLLYKHLVTIGALLAGLVYMLNPWFILRLQHVYLLVGYAFLPFVMHGAYLLFVRNISTTRFKHHFLRSPLSLWLAERLSLFINTRNSLLIVALFTAFAWSLASSSIHYFFFLVFIVTTWAFIEAFSHLAFKKYSAVWQVGSRLTFLACLVFLSVAYWFLPQVAMQATGGVFPSNINSIDSLALLSRHLSPKNVMFGVSYWWGYFDPTSLPITFWLGGGLLVLVSAFSLTKIYIRTIFLVVMGYVLTLLLALGPHGPMRWLYMKALFSDSLISKVGFLIRDPDKFTGLMMFFFSIMVGVGFAVLASQFHHIIQILQKAKDSLNRQYFYLSLFYIMLFSIVVALFFYIMPMRQLYGNHFFKNVDQPISYTETQEALEGANTSHWISLPRYEDTVSPGHGFAVSSWNSQEIGPQRPTSSVDLWTLPGKTYHPLEGAHSRVKHMYLWFETVLAEGSSNRLITIWKHLGLSHVLYHDDLVLSPKHELSSGWAENNKEGELTKKGFFEVLKLQQASAGHVFNSIIFSEKGLSSMGAYVKAGILKNDSIPIFGNDASAKNALETLTKADYLDTLSIDSLALSTIPVQYQLPFTRSIYRANPFTAWAQTATAQYDWWWHTQYLGLGGLSFELDSSRGVAFTHAPAELAVLPFDELPEGNVLVNMEQVTADESFFTTHAPDFIDLKVEPTSRFDVLPAIQAEVVSGSSPVWRVVSSKHIPVRPQVAHKLDLTLSSKEAIGLHIKIQFLDRFGDEVGVAYAAAPTHVTSFDALKFNSTFITPIDAAHIQVQLWSNEAPTQKSYWWLHDFTLSELPGVSKENKMSIPFTIEEGGKHKVYIKALRSWAGGSLRSEIGEGEPYIIDTTIPKETIDHLLLEKHQEYAYARKGLEGYHNFDWISLGTYDLEKGKNNLSLVNTKGFNAIIDVVVIPEDAWKEHRFKTSKAALRATQVITLEAEKDMNLRDAHVQAIKKRPIFSGGEAIYLNNGSLSRDIEILEDGNYFIDVFVDPNMKTSGGASMVVVLDSYNSSQDGFFEKVDLDSMDDTGRVSIKLQGLKKGRYDLVVDLEDKSSSLISYRDMHQLRHDELIDVYNFFPFDIQQDCCYCQRLLPSEVLVKPAKGYVDIVVDEGHSCQWAIIASNIVDVFPGEEWLLSFDLKAELSKYNHAKIFFLDEDGVIIDTSFLTETLSSETYDWNSIQTIIDVPEGAHGMQFHLWSRKNPLGEGYLGVRDLILKRYRSLPHVDMITIYPQNTFELKIEKENLETINADTHGNSRKISLDGSPKGFVMHDSYQPLWKLVGQDSIHVSGYGILNAYILRGEKAEGGLKYTLGLNRYMYGLGWLCLLTYLGILLAVIINSIKVQYKK